MSRKTTVLGILIIHFGLLVYLAWENSPNDMEANLLPSGLLNVKYARFDIAQVNPPLSRIVVAVPLFFMDVKEDWHNLVNAPGNRPEYAVGKDFVRNNIDSIQEIFFFCRFGGILFSLIGAIGVFYLAKKLFGDQAGSPTTFSGWVP